VIIASSKTFNNSRLSEFLDYLELMKIELQIGEQFVVKNSLEIIDFSAFLGIDKTVFKSLVSSTEKTPHPVLANSVKTKLKLEKVGVRSAAFRIAQSKTDAIKSAEDLSPPFRLYTSFNERFALHPEDLGLAYVQVADSDRHEVVVESTAGNSAVTALLCMHSTGHNQIIWFETKWMSESLQFPIQISSLDADQKPDPQLEESIQKIIDGLELTCGVYRIDFVRNQNEEWVVRQIEPLTMSDWLPLEWWQTELGHSILSTILQCMCDRPFEYVQPKRQSVVQWLETHSGNVLSVTGQDQARTLHGVTRVDLTVEAGDVMRHVVDRESRDQVGFVIAEGNNSIEAKTAAQNAVREINITTENVMETPFDA
jgi:hypothetical protein